LSPESSIVKTSTLGLGDVDLVAEHADPSGRRGWVLIEDLGLVGLAVAIGVFEDDDAIAFGRVLNRR